MAKHGATSRLRGQEDNHGKGSGDENDKGNRPIRPEGKEQHSAKGSGKENVFDPPFPDKGNRIRPEGKERRHSKPLADRSKDEDPIQRLHEDGNGPLGLVLGNEEGNTCTVPRQLYNLLKPHQREGLRWLWGIHCNYSGGIIADDMGLGKTLQIAVFLSSLFYSNIILKGLIITPVSVLTAWAQELERAGLNNHFQTYNTAGERGLQIVNKDGGFLLTSYEMYCSNKMILMKYQWNYLVMDEAHKVKNLAANVREALDTIKCNKKILMTGTPMTRNLLDIFSLMKFVNPDVLGKEQSFRKEYMGPVEMGQYLNSTESNRRQCLKALARCKNKISPYMLRRTKSVLIESGEIPCTKHDVIVWLRLTEFQAGLYSKLCNIYDQEAHALSAGEKTAYTHKILGQHICNAPEILLIHDDGNSSSVRRMVRRLVSTVDDEAACRELENSCKISFILDIVHELLEQEKIELDKGVKENKKLKILMFSQSIYMLDRVQAALAAVMKEGDIIRVDGSTARTERDSKIEQFRSEDGPIIFLLSARVGGEGLNLTAATRVIIIDPSWNISDDNQIADRVYRIGQDEDVTIYRLFTCMTIEEYVYKTQLIKGILAQAILDGKMCSPLVEQKDGRMLRLPKSGFNSSETQKFLESMTGSVLGIDEMHENFLRTHYLVAGLTNQNNVFSHKKTSLSDYTESSDEDDSASESEEKQSAKFDGHIDPVHPDLEKKNVLPSSFKFRELRRSKRGAASKQKECAVPECTKRIQIPANKVGLLVGREGATITRIRTLSSAIIVLNPDRHPNPDPNPIEIRGTPKEIQKAEELIMDIISKAETICIKDSTSDTVEVHFPVPGTKVGLIIGKNGRKVQEIELNSGATIRQRKPENILRIRGSRTACDKASAMISEIINKAFTSSSSRSLLTEGSGNTSFPWKAGSSSYGVERNAHTPKHLEQPVSSLVLTEGGAPRETQKAGAASGSYGSCPESGMMAQLPYMPPRKATAPPGFSAGCNGGRALEHGYRPAAQSPVQQPQPAAQEPPQQAPCPSVRSEYYGERGEGYRGRGLAPTSRRKNTNGDT